MHGSRYPLRVQFGDCDPAQIAYYPHFFQWFDTGTHALFESAGVSMKSLAAARISVPLVHVEADFVSPARWGDHLVVESRFEHLGTRSLKVSHQVETLEGRVVAKGREVRAFIRLSAEPERATAIDVPEDVRQAAQRPAREGTGLTAAR